jgi:hypothetical protein
MKALHLICGTALLLLGIISILGKDTDPVMAGILFILFGLGEIANSWVRDKP